MNRIALALWLCASGPLLCAQSGLPRRPIADLVAQIERTAAGAVLEPAPGVYEGPLRIQRAIIIDGRGQVVIDGLGQGSVIEVLHPDVNLRRLVVRGSGIDVTGEPAGIRCETGPVVLEDNQIEDVLFGIDLRTSPGSIVRRNSVRVKPLDPGRRGDGIRTWWSKDGLIEDNDVLEARDMVFWYSENLKIRRNRVRDGRYGLHFMYSHDTVLQENDLSGNSVGIYLMYSHRITLEANRMRNNRGTSGYGLGLKDCDDISIRGNALLANRVGFYIDNSPSSVGSFGRFEGNLVAFNEIGLLATPNTHETTFTQNAFIENEQPATTHGRGSLALNRFSDAGRGNFWSDYAGYDRDGDGIGDLAHAPQSLFGALLAREPNLRLFVHSPAQEAVEFTARAVPTLRPEAIFRDPHPLTEPPPFELPLPAVEGQVLGMSLLAGLFIVGSGLALLWLGREKGLAAENVEQTS